MPGDGRPYFYDINALSNFIADAPRVLGFDPFARLADWLQRELGPRFARTDLMNGRASDETSLQRSPARRTAAPLLS